MPRKNSVTSSAKYVNSPQVSSSSSSTPFPSTSTSLTKRSEAQKRKVSKTESFATLPPEKLAKLLECPICFEIPIELPIYICNKGHSVCETCKGKLTICPQCYKMIKNIRNYGMEALVRSSLVECKYNECMEVHSGAVLANHLKVCEYRDLACYEANCKICKGTMIGLDDFGNHLATYHKIKETPMGDNGYFVVNYNDYAKVFFKNKSWTTGHVQFDGKTFLINARNVEGIFHHWISFMGTETEARKYIYSTHSVTKKELDESSKSTKKNAKNVYKQFVSSNVLVHSHHNTLRNLEEFGDCFTIKLKFLEKQCTSPESREPNGMEFLIACVISKHP